jgi:hypothetical protein
MGNGNGYGDGDSNGDRDGNGNEDGQPKTELRQLLTVRFSIQ